MVETLARGCWPELVPGHDLLCGHGELGRKIQTGQGFLCSWEIQIVIPEGSEPSKVLPFRGGWLYFSLIFPVECGNAQSHSRKSPKFQA